MNVPMNVPINQPINATLPKPASIVMPGRKPDPRASFRRHRKLALAAAAAVVCAGLFVALFLTHPKYQAEVVIRISPTFPTAFQESAWATFSSGPGYDDFVQEQVFEIANFATMTKALKLLGPQRDLWQHKGEPDRRAAERLLWAAKAQVVPDSHLISISLEGSHPQGLAPIVTAIADAYLLRQDYEKQNNSDLRVQLLTSQKADLQRQIDENHARQAQLTQELGIPPGESENGFVNPYDKLLTSANDQLSRATNNLNLAQAHLSALQNEQQQLKNVDLSANAAQIVARDQDVASSEMELAKQRESVFLQLRGLGPDHPGRPGLEQEMADIDAEIARVNADALQKAKAVLRAKHDLDARLALSAAQAAVDEAQRVQQDSQTGAETLRTKALAVSSGYAKAAALHDLIAQEQKQVQDVDTRMNLLRLVTQSPGFAAIDTPARTPDLPEKSRRRAIFGLSLIGALMLGIGLPIGLDMIDPKVKAASELQALAGFMPLGVASLSRGAAARDALARIALGIIRERRRSGIRGFVLVPAREDAGTTSLTLELARVLTQLGSRAIAIEADGTAPDIRYLDSRGASASLVERNERLGPSGRTGMSNPLDPRPHIISKAVGRLPDRIAICRHDGRPQLTLECARHLMDLALTHHDIVLFDAPPLLESIGAAMLVELQVGAILVVRVNRDTGADVAAAVRELERLAPPVVGTILNAIHPGGSTTVEIMGGDGPAVSPGAGTGSGRATPLLEDEEAFAIESFLC